MRTSSGPRVRLAGTIGLLSSVALLCACSQSPGGHPPRPATVQPIGNDQQLGDAIARLESGDAASARKLLRAMAKRDPGDARTAELLASIDADPVATLGAKSFEYRVESGDRMITLAQHYLGTRFKFYLLSRYNGIAVPASLRAGQSIRIPGTAPPPAVRVAQPEAKRAEPPPKPSPPAVAPKAAARDPRRAAQLRGAGLSALNQGNPARAVGLLRQAALADPGNAAIQHDLGRAQRLEATVRAHR